MINIINLLWSLVLGAVVGWGAGKIMKTGGSLLRNVIVGIVGSILGGFLFGLIGIGANNLIGSLLVSLVGACLLIWIVKKVFK